MVGAYERGETLTAAPAGHSSSERYRTLEVTPRVQEGLVCVVLQKGLSQVEDRRGPQPYEDARLAPDARKQVERAQDG